MRTRIIALLTLALTGASVLLVVAAGPAMAHHAYFDLAASAADLPGGGGDPDGTLNAVLDFDIEDSNQLCIDYTAVTGLVPSTTAEIQLRQNDSVLITLPTVDGCMTATMEQLEAIHDSSDTYYVRFANSAFPDGAVGAAFAERAPTTTTSSSVVTTSTTSVSPSVSPTSAVAPTTTAIPVVSPAFTG